ncbi:galactose-1-epimerase [Pedobacter yulinensis]|uniref:Aldose 1-epimerase n=1 Tax=Pedobacter yulinensis TaxID=2126353 RepID=A0A2T3HKT3_9SPHI|nr:aldose epimerase family protein [Pedobacter yulinensis]PST83036.1 galactose-1-epimerase [Pedobacter yulinensis]
MKVTQTPTGKNKDGADIYAIDLENNTGTKVRIFNYGTIINSFKIINKSGQEQDIVLGFDDIDGYLSPVYLANYPYFGAIIGRYANRIAGGQISIEGKTYELAKNVGGATLHGGLEGFDKKVWEIVDTMETPHAGVVLGYTSPDGEEQFPGTLDVQLTFELTDHNELILSYEAETDAPTAINLTHHSYFNLSPEGGSVENHHQRINASHYLEQDDNFTVTGKLIDVTGTHHDFRHGKRVGENWDAEFGYDQTYVLDKKYGELTLASETTEPVSGLKLQVYTTEPVAHLYTAKYTEVENGKGGRSYGPFSGFCVETQHHPNGINIADFPSTVLKPGDVYHQTTIYKIIV